MRGMGIVGLCPGPNTSRRSAEHRVSPYRLRPITASRPNPIWGIDITYIRLPPSYWRYFWFEARNLIGQATMLNYAAKRGSC